MEISTAAAATFYETNPDAAKPYAPRPASTSRDMARLSRNGRMLGEALKSAHAAPDVREDKIAALREKIASGTYEIDAARIARALIREEAGLFQI